MKPSLPVTLLSTVVLSTALVAGCSYMDSQSSSASATKASPAATAAIASANKSIKTAKANHWIWRDTEKFAQQAQAAADKGDNKTAIKMANKAKAQADDAIKQYEYEKAHPRGL